MSGTGWSYEGVCKVYWEAGSLAECLLARGVYDWSRIERSGKWIGIERYACILLRGVRGFRGLAFGFANEGRLGWGLHGGLQQHVAGVWLCGGTSSVRVLANNILLSPLSAYCLCMPCHVISSISYYSFLRYR